MTHMEPAEVAREQDLGLAEHIRTLDAEGLLAERQRRDITMCGYGPVAAMLLAAVALGATRAEILAYHNSGEVAPMSEVVGYLSAKVER
jgi:AmmeMemoRadiSam system protein B